MTTAIDKLLEGKLQKVELFQMGGQTYHSKEAAAKAVLDGNLRSRLIAAMNDHQVFKDTGIYPSHFERVVEKIVSNMELRVALRGIFMADMDLDPILASEAQKELQELADGLDMGRVQTVDDPPATPAKKEDDTPEGSELGEQVSAQGNTVFSPNLDDIDSDDDKGDETSDDIPEEAKLSTPKTNRTRAGNRAKR